MCSSLVQVLCFLTSNYIQQTVQSGVSCGSTSKTSPAVDIPYSTVHNTVFP